VWHKIAFQKAKNCKFLILTKVHKRKVENKVQLVKQAHVLLQCC